MDLITIFVIAVGLSMDAFAVSVASGASYKQLHHRSALNIALFFGVFQAVMPIIGWLAGLTFRQMIQDYDHWVAFVLLVAIGSKMIYESFAIKKRQNPMDLYILLALSVATSIDALAVGITLSLLTNSIATAVIIIGLVTFIFSYAGIYLGKKIGHLFENRIEMIGGIVLITIGLKILFQHII